MADMNLDKSSTTEKAKGEASSPNAVDISSVQDGQSYSAAHYRSTAQKLSAARNAAAGVSKPVKKSNTSVKKGSKIAETATKKRKASTDKSPAKKKATASAKVKKPRKTSKDAGGKKGNVRAKSPAKKATAAKDKKPTKISKDAVGKKKTVQPKVTKSIKKKQ